MGYRIGMDGGGTRTRIAVIEEGTECFRCETGGINYNSFSKTEIMDNLSSGLLNLSEHGYLPGECESIGIGAAGVSNHEAEPFLKKCVSEMGFTCDLVVAGDQEAALLGGVGQAPGILLIAGTGSICIAQDGEGNHFRAGGYGHIIDDAGSAYAAGRDILAAIVRAQDGRGQETALQSDIFEKLGITQFGNLITWIYDKKRTKREIAALASCLTPERMTSDYVAAGIADKAAEELVLLIKAVLKNLYLEESGKYPLLLEGGLILQNERIRNHFWALLTKENFPVYPAEKKNDAAFGAAFLKKKPS